ncbi:hypothetical protein A2961_01280 [Candidatus Woesebacteria bacterium RIFCSPLOWO2_01_FULL_39_21]|uniref:Solute-binding protein family 5 domain-containing protein n=1 Tax=Candidatus Woesebacteria bacterium RIFCSPLOWO2_01_FULL_39_21 TaxID=1802519 RepID=A0A1F8BGH7_9BACT|nr:MAG: hypothetical protein A2691_03695 [Candidatus Woesebacteria bacterium RIFCSPHIGHO2_01_FULL_39_23]OGM63154.1 MAG: hypothetical protein A2961_01280 [Candidatus Woesebacteria bacterium RIFCSPLOWO2_01_FULL_39_21]
MFTIRYLTRLLIEFIIRFRLVFILSIIIGTISFFFVRAIAPLIFDNKIVRIGISGRFTVEDIPYNIQRQISRGLTKTEESGKVEPDLAQSWETPDKGKTWIFILKKDLKWNDGSPLKSRDLNYNFSDVISEFPDENTIVFKLSTPYSPFPVVVSKPVFKKGLLGVSSWKIDKITLMGSFVQTLAISDDSGTKKIYKFYPTEDQTKLAFRTAEVDKIEGLIDPKPLDSWNTVKIANEVNRNRLVIIFINTEDNLLTDKTLRQAFAYAIDKESLGERASSPISINSWAYNPQVKSYDYDKERAKEIMDQYLKDKDNKILEVKIASYPSLLPVAEKIAQNLKEIGVNTSVQVSSITPHEYQLFLAIYDIPIDPDQYSVWHSTQIETNITKYKSPRIDNLLEDGRTELDFESRKKIYLDFQRFLLEDSPAIFLYYPEYYSVERL